jgi:hypothetical protein
MDMDMDEADVNASQEQDEADSGMVVDMRGGGRLDDIESSFRNQSLTMNRDGDWFDTIGITGEDIVAKCAEIGKPGFGQADPSDKEKIVKTWGKEVLDADVPPRPAGMSIEDYNRTYRKAADMKAFNTCNLKYTDTRDLLYNEERDCNSLVCSSKARADTPRIENEDEYRDKMADPRYTRHHDKLERCHSRDMHVCQEAQFPDIDPEKFQVVWNSGYGDCLFIAFIHYMHLHAQLKAGANTLVTLLTKKGNPKSGFNDHAEALKLRKRVIEWYQKNADKPRNPAVYGPQTVKEGLATEIMDLGGIRPMQYKPYLAMINSNQKIVNRAGIHVEYKARDLAGLISDIEDIRSIRVDNPLYARSLDMIIDIMFNGYLAEMSKNTQYGGSPEIEALSKDYGVNIYTVQANEDQHGVKYDTNQGLVVDPRADNYYILHTMDVKGIGSLHYVILFKTEGATIDYKSAPVYRGISEPELKVAEQEEQEESEYQEEPESVSIQEQIVEIFKTKSFMEEYVEVLEILADNVSYDEFQQYVAEIISSLPADERLDIKLTFFQHSLPLVSVVAETATETETEESIVEDVEIEGTTDSIDELLQGYGLSKRTVRERISDHESRLDIWDELVTVSTPEELRQIGIFHPYLTDEDQEVIQDIFEGYDIEKSDAVNLKAILKKVNVTPDKQKGFTGFMKNLELLQEYLHRDPDPLLSQYIHKFIGASASNMYTTPKYRDHVASSQPPLVESPTDRLITEYLIPVAQKFK